MNGKITTAVVLIWDKQRNISVNNQKLTFLQLTLLRQVVMRKGHNNIRRRLSNRYTANTMGTAKITQI